jgi:hypothetical protein
MTSGDRICIYRRNHDLCSDACALRNEELVVASTVESMCGNFVKTAASSRQFLFSETEGNCFRCGGSNRTALRDLNH